MNLKNTPPSQTEHATIPSSYLPPMATTVSSILSAKENLMFSYQADTVQVARERIVLVPDQKCALFMAEKSRLDFVFHTAALEGNPFTFPEIQTLLEGVTVGGHKVSDADQVMNLNKAHTFLLQMVKAGTFEISAPIACAIQGVVAREETLKWAEFRDAMVTIAGTNYRPPSPDLLPSIFDRGEQTLKAVTDPILRALLVFLWGSINQFFYDGNKRTSRLLSNGTLLMAGYPPLMVKAQDQLAYNQVMTRFYDTQDATEALVWFCDYYREQVTGFGFEPKE